MCPSHAPFDVAILGAGPSGSMAARLLASWGHRVVLVHKPGEGHSLAESLPPSARRLFEAFGVGSAIDRAGFQPWRGNTVCWARERRVEWFPDGVSGFHVERARFDRLLRSQATETGAALVEAVATGVGVEEDEAAPVRVDVDRGVPGSRLEARFVLDCAGRASLLARTQRLRRLEADARTVAVAGVWTRPGGWNEVDETHAFIETYDDGWVWSVPIARERRYVTVMVDPRTTELERGGGAARVYRSELAKAAQLAPLLRASRLEDGPWGFDASLYTSSCFHGSRFLLVGDAGSSLDPLSSFGVKKALASAWLASVAAHTWLERPSMRAAALRFFDDHEREVYASYRRQGHTFAASAAAAHDHPFWTERLRAALTEMDPAEDVETLRKDPDVLRAFAAIREAPALELRRTARARVERRAGVAGREIVMQDCLVMDRCPRGLRYLRNVDLPHLVEIAPGYADAGELFEAYNRTRAPVALPDFLGALSVLVAWGVLELRA